MDDAGMGLGNVPIAAEAIGRSTVSVPVEISTRFLQHFSEQLYSSPQKAFEELISNGWDAGADYVDVRIPADLAAPTATMTVLDNGASMDEQGMRDLWHIAFSPKQEQPVQNGRHVVGKFGIGKLATYVLASHLTYICRASDGIIRRVTMNYGDIDRNASKDKLISEIKLQMFEVGTDELETAVHALDAGSEILRMMKEGVNSSAKDARIDDDFGAPKSAVQRETKGTWTLVILSGLKPTGRSLKIGVLKRMLEAALPLSSEMIVRINGDELSSSKISSILTKEWLIGPELKITDLDILNVDDEEAIEKTNDEKKNGQKISVTSGVTPYPYIDLPEIGKVTGIVRLYQDKISGGKAEERGTSNGFFVNVLGRVVNQADPSFGAENLSHAAWARFRMTVRADGLNKYLNTNREQFREQRALLIFRAFLRKAFNVARAFHDSDKLSELPDGGDALVKSLGVVSLGPLRSAVSETLRTKAPIPGLFDESNIGDREEKRKNWRENTADHIQNALAKVKFEKLDDNSFVKFRIYDSSIIINRDHPFVAEHSRTKAEKELMRTVAMVNLLADVYALETGIEPSKVEDLREYRDQIMRYRALKRRQSGAHIARLLQTTQHRSGDSKQLEIVVGDALRYIGFTVREIGGSGEPEGIASAFAFGNLPLPTDDEPNPPLYKFTYDAKSTKHVAAKTGNTTLDAIHEHKKRYKAEYALVVAADFETGALVTRCGNLQITPMRASDLGRLLEYTVEYGAIPLDTLQKIFDFHDPQLVTAWVDELKEKLKKGRKFTIDLFLKALEILRGKVPDALQPSVISLTCRTQLGVPTVVDKEVVALVKGLQILVPDLIGIDASERIVVNASAERVGAAVSAQLEKLRADIDDVEESEAKDGAVP